MKQVIAIIRDERVEATKEALEAAGIRGVTFLYVTGRGQQKGKVNSQEMGESLTRHLRMQLGAVSPDNEPDAGTRVALLPFQPDTEFAFGFLPKRMLIMVLNDEDVNLIVRTIVNVNQTGRHGDGRIFICPMIGAIRVRTGEQGDKALS
jgi:nitrogen regulatory protein PII 2